MARLYKIANKTNIKIVIAIAHKVRERRKESLD